MKAIIVQAEQEGRPLIWQEAPTPGYAADEVLVNVSAAALNRADLLQRAGNYPPPPGASQILGLEVAGRIAAMGADVTGWQIGDRVCALLSGGGYAEQVNVPAAMLMPVPAGWSDAQAAAIPEAFFTAYLNLFLEAGLRSGETVLIHGGASGVGTAAIQLVRSAGGRALVTVGSEEKAARCRELGAELAINYKQEDFAERILAHTDGAGVDVILDSIGAAYFERNIRLLKLRGRLVFIASMGGSRTELNIPALMGRRLRLIGSVLRSRSLAEKIEIRERFMTHAWPSLLDGTLQPVIDSIHPIEQANDAHRRMAENRNIGKIILLLDES
ncbi:MAG: NAD(P)H-quinone oxidoreductase [Blastocatellia bacterium]|nr:NAD(P)H-quinone oxidoreductase [Blastocatellia bacterium]